MNAEERLGIMAEVARRKQNRKGRLGKTAMLKLMYLLQEGYGVPLGYRFSLYTYGPYTSAVMDEIDYGDLAGALTVQFDPDRGYSIAPGQRADAFARPDTAAEGLDKLMSDFGDMTARDLESRSTILYLNSGKAHLDDKQLVEMVREIKPKFMESEVAGALEQLRSCNLVATRP